MAADFGTLMLIAALFGLIVLALMADHLPRWIERLIAVREANAEARALEARAALDAQPTEQEASDGR